MSSFFGSAGEEEAINYRKLTSKLAQLSIREDEEWQYACQNMTLPRSRGVIAAVKYLAHNRTRFDSRF